MAKTNAVLALALAFAATWNSSGAQPAPDRHHQKLQPIVEKLIRQQELPGFAIGYRG